MEETKEIKLYKGLRLTSSDDGVFLHFDSGKKQSGVCLGLDTISESEFWKSVAYEWAEGLFKGAQSPYSLNL